MYKLPPGRHRPLPTTQPRPRCPGDHNVIHGIRHGPVSRGTVSFLLQHCTIRRPMTGWDKAMTSIRPFLGGSHGCWLCLLFIRVVDDLR